MSEPIVMLASIPPIMTALKVDGSGGARLQLDIPDSETEAIKALLDMRGAELVVTVQRREAQGETEQPTVRRWNERRH
jgi:hypothetical protein